MPAITTANTASELARSATSTSVRVAARELELFDTGDVAGADEVFWPDLIDHNAADSTVPAIDGMRTLIAAVGAGFSDIQHRVLFHEDLPDGWVVLHWRMTATHTGEAFGVAPSGNEIEINGTDIMRVVDGKISELYHVEELLKLVQQIGASA